MANMEFIQTEIPDIILVKPNVIEDHRGFFMESYHIEKFKIGGINCTFVQDNHAKSVQNTLRGLHFQVQYPQAKLLRCLKGKVFDVAVDIRQDSPYFGKWVGEELSEIKGKFTAAIDKDKKMTTLINILNLKSILIIFLEIITLRIKITK